SSDVCSSDLGVRDEERCRLSGVERGPRCGPLTVFSRVAPRVVAPVRSPRRAVERGGYSIVASAQQYDLGFAVASAFERDAQARRPALVPGGLDQQPAHVAVAGLGDRALAAPLPTGVLAGGETEERSKRLGTEPAAVAEL